MSDKTKKVYRIPPCPDYDVESMESWLTDMAADGCVLVEDGIFAGVATFEKTQPQKLKYRLEAAQKSTSMWADDGGEPDPEAVELSKLYGWKYVAKRGRFYIYCSDDPTVREMNTDPQVQALALDYVRKSQRDHVFTIIWWTLMYPLIGIRGALLLFSVNVGSWLMLMALGCVIWGIINSAIGLSHLNRMKKDLLETGQLYTGRNWKDGRTKYLFTETCRVLLIIVWIIAAFIGVYRASDDSNATPLKDFSGEVPFATMADFAPDGEYELENWGFSNSVRIWDDLLSPCSVDWDELAHIDLPDGRTLEGGLYVDYNELPYDWMAAWAAKEYWISDLKKREKSLELPQLDLDYAVGYTDGIFPTVILRKDNKVIHAYFYQTSDDYRMDLARWVTILADSIG